MMRNLSRGDSRGVALIAALFVLMVMSILAVGLLMNVEENLKITKNTENSEAALKVAEAGVRIAAASFFDLQNKEINATERLYSVNGFIHGGYFLTQMRSGFSGNEKWIQWHYNASVTGYNIDSDITNPVRRVWATAAPGQNGSWTTGGSPSYYVGNIFGIVAKGVYFPIEYDPGATTDTKVRAHHEFTGAQDLGFWKEDKVVTNTTQSVAYAAKMSPMASFSNYSTGTGDLEPTLLNQTLYFTYSGSGTAIGGEDRSSTVRLRAANARCNATANNAPVSWLWEFDTGVHGFGTAPAFFDPDPDVPGNEILYFAVVSMGTPGSSHAADIGSTNTSNAEVNNFPVDRRDEPEQIYVFAVVDNTTDYTSCGQGSYTVKWVHRFPDPDVADWTDYPIEVGTGTGGTSPPYINLPADILPNPPEDDVIPDYRDGTYPNNSDDNQQNQVRANISCVFYPQAISPVVLNVLYKDANGNLTTNRALASDEGRANPLINLYVMYSVVTRGHRSDTDGYWYYQNVYYSERGGNTTTDGWGGPGDRKQVATQERVLALRDRVLKGGVNAINGWDWTAARSRFPTLKWVYAVPGPDPDNTDVRPPNGYGEYNWDTYFAQQIAPMIRVAEMDQDHQLWTNVAASGRSNLYPVVYPYYESQGFPTNFGDDDTLGTGRKGPTIGEGSPVDLSGKIMTYAHLMVMAARDTWDDYMQGNQTNPLYYAMLANPMSNPSRSNPVEPYWTHTDGSAPNVANYKSPSYPMWTSIAYDGSMSTTGSLTTMYPYVANANKIGFPRPYDWSEDLWIENVKNAYAGKPWSMSKQGWSQVVGGSGDDTNDGDVEGETSSMCTNCLGGDGLMVFTFNHDLTNNREDFRVHAINATTGIHRWDYHVPAALAGDNANGTSAIANNRVFVGYVKYGAEDGNANQYPPDPRRQVRMEILSADDGHALQVPAALVDDDADALILPPMLANGVVYVGTLKHRKTSDFSDDIIRMFAMSPVIRLESTGIYPMDYTDARFVTYTGMLKDKQSELSKNIKSSKRKLQVWITGNVGKWEELRDEITP
jgi:Tfp pilus assembly protein PilX